jgi:hypothetical protein
MTWTRIVMEKTRPHGKGNLQMTYVPRVVPLPLALAGAVGIAFLSSACAGRMSDDAVGRELHADAEAIKADKERIDLDIQTGNLTALVKDRHKLYLDIERQEHDRGTEDDELAEGEISF